MVRRASYPGAPRSASRVFKDKLEYRLYSVLARVLVPRLQSGVSPHASGPKAKLENSLEVPDRHRI